MNRPKIKSIVAGFISLGMLSACSDTGDVDTEKAEVNLKEPYETACQEYFLDGIEAGEFLDEYTPEIITRCDCLYVAIDPKLEDKDIVFLTNGFAAKDPDNLESQIIETLGEKKSEVFFEDVMACANP